jgi:thiamine biosynthesis lipoprotein
VITPVAAFTRHAFSAFGGATCEIVACDVAEDAVSAAVAETYAFEGQLTRFDPRSELSRFNSAAGEYVPVTPLLEALLRAALEAFVLSEGLVNAACHNALVAAGYDAPIAAVRRRIESPRAQKHGPVSPLPEVLEVQNGRARLARGCAIDLGGVGKSWLADALCERFDNAVVNLGGDLRARGDGRDGLGWSVGLCDGRAVYAHDAGVATSGTSGRHWVGGHHLIDPRTGRPAATDAAAISVVAGDAFTAEVLAKAACVLGSDEALRWLRGHGALRQAAIWSATVGTV